MFWRYQGYLAQKTAEADEAVLGDAPSGGSPPELTEAEINAALEDLEEL